MAQAKVTNFFAVRKKKDTLQPSKRLKVHHTAEETHQDTIPEEDKVIEKNTVRVCTRSRAQAARVKGLEAEQQPLEQDGETRPTKTKANVPRTRARKRTTQSKSQPTMKTALSKIKNTKRESASSRDDATKDSAEEEALEPEMKQEEGEVATAACDDHWASPPSSPAKASSQKSSTLAGKRSRRAISLRKNLLEEGPAPSAAGSAATGFDFSPFIKSGQQEAAAAATTTTTTGESRRKLVMKRRSDDCLNEKGAEQESSNETQDQPEKVSSNGGSSNSQKTPEIKRAEVPSVIESETKDAQNAETKLDENKTKPKSTVASLKTLDPAVVRARLAKSGKLAELQERLSQFKTSAEKVKKEKSVQRLADLKTEKEKANEAAKAPAFERYHTLATEVQPGLHLAYRYRQLLDVFHSVDTVVSMLHKRLEVCTFSKLKNAVQVMTRRTFEEQTLGQIHTVYPEAYILRQEKGIPVHGTGRLSNWQLTIEANLEQGMADKNCPRDKDGKVAFSPSMLLERKSIFHNLLIKIMKEYHKVFLSKLDRPLTVPDDKVTRWHPRFSVDEVPDIEPAALPQPPDVKKFSTANEVLEQARIKNTVLNARVQKALENMANQKKEAEACSSTSEKSDKRADSSDQKSAPQATKGIPQSLLERIRAKEAERQVQAMMVSPAEEKRKEMISRLPDVVRIIRTFFVTYKKPCLLMEDAIKKVSESSKSRLGNVEAESHIKLLVELVPDWISTVEIRKGKYLKIDRNQDTSSVINKLNTALKT